MNVNKISKELKDSLKETFPDESFKIILYGSYARGESNNYSDIDILIIFETPINLKTKDKVYELCCALNIKYNIWIDISLISNHEMDTIKGKQPFVQNALNEGIYI